MTSLSKSTKVTSLATVLLLLGSAMTVSAAKYCFYLGFGCTICIYSQ